jgi:hypothetical protein
MIRRVKLLPSNEKQEALYDIRFGFRKNIQEASQDEYVQFFGPCNAIEHFLA